MNHVKEKHEGAECYCGNCGDRTENNGHLELHKQVGHWVEMEIEMRAVKLDGQDVGKYSEIRTHTGACC